MTKAPVAAGVVLMLVACSSVDDMRRHEPRGTYTSARSRDDVVRCLVAEVHGYGDASTLPVGSDTTEISYRPQGNTVLLISVKNEGKGSAVTVRQKLGFLSRRAVEGCL